MLAQGQAIRNRKVMGGGGGGGGISCKANRLGKKFLHGVNAKKNIVFDVKKKSAKHME